MPDATERGGAMQAVYHTVKSKKDPMSVERMDKNKVLEASRKMSMSRGNKHNQIKPKKGR